MHLKKLKFSWVRAKIEVRYQFNQHKAAMSLLTMSQMLVILEQADA
jgi:hypothetical protein